MFFKESICCLFMYLLEQGWSFPWPGFHFFRQPQPFSCLFPVFFRLFLPLSCHFYAFQGTIFCDFLAALAPHRCILPCAGGSRKASGCWIRGIYWRWNSVGWVELKGRGWVCLRCTGFKENKKVIEEIGGFGESSFSSGKSEEALGWTLFAAKRQPTTSPKDRQLRTH